MALRAIKGHVVIFRSRRQGAHPRASTLTGRRARCLCSVGRAIVAKLAIKGRWDGWTTRCVAKRKEERKGPGKENERRSARVPTMSMTLRARTVVSLLHLLLLFLLSFFLSLFLVSMWLLRTGERVRIHPRVRVAIRHSLSRSVNLKHYCSRLQQQSGLLSLELATSLTISFRIDYSLNYVT